MVKRPLDHVFLGTAAVATKNDHVIQESASGVSKTGGFLRPSVGGGANIPIQESASGGSKTEGFLLVQHYNSDRGARFCSAIAQNSGVFAWFYYGC